MATMPTSVSIVVWSLVTVLHLPPVRTGPTSSTCRRSRGDRCRTFAIGEERNTTTYRRRDNLANDAQAMTEAPVSFLGKSSKILDNGSIAWRTEKHHVVDSEAKSKRFRTPISTNCQR
jgi:hypothetical protein